MATPTYTPIASITLGSSASSVEFSSIPQDYRDLVWVIQGTKSTFSYNEVSVNGSYTNSSIVFMKVATAGSNITSSSVSGDFIGNVSYTGTTPFQIKMQIQDYSATDKHKTALIESTHTNTGSGNDPIGVGASRHESTTAISSLEIRAASGTFDTGSTFALYGIAS